MTSQDLFEELKKIIPELPDTCVSLTLRMGVDEVPSITLEFFPAKKEDKERLDGIGYRDTVIKSFYLTQEQPK